MKTNRRNFLKLIGLGFLSLSFNPFKNVFAKKTLPPKTPTGFPDLVGVKDGSPAQMFEMGIEAMGGMKRFVKKGQTVLVKPNIGWNKTPNEGANTHPDLIGKIIEEAYKAGASKVDVFDHTCNEESACYENSGAKKIIKQSKGILHTAEDEKAYRTVKIPGAKILKEAKVHQLFLDADVIINVPILKHHAGTGMTAAMKNFMGVVWDRSFWHREGLNQSIADFPLLRKIDLTVIDAYTIMTRNGPRGISSNDLELKKMQILSTDMVLADTAATKIMNLKVTDVDYIKMAEKHGIGTTNIDKSYVKRISCKA